MTTRTVIRRGVAVVAVVGLVGGGYAAYAAAGESGASYRTAVASTSDVEKTLALTGTIEPAGRADLAFGTSGTVGSVRVSAGDRVKAGQVLARLDRRSLRHDVSAALSEVASAKAQLEADEDAQSETVSSATEKAADTQTQSSAEDDQQQPDQQETDQPTPDDGADGGQDDALADALAEALEALAGQQQAVTSAQSAATAAITDAKAALAAQTTACENAFEPDPSPEPSEDPTDGPTQEPTPEPEDPADAACAAALAAVQSAQDTVAAAQDALQSALGELAGTLTSALQVLQQAAQQPPDDEEPTPTPKPTPTQPVQPEQETPDVETPSADTPAVTVTASTLARDQAAIDEARAGLVAARQALRSATLRAPYAGTVASVDIARGDAASAGSDVLVVVAHGTTTVELDVTDTQVRQLERGQLAEVTPAGAEQSLAGKATRIGAVPTTDDTGTSTYPVTITLTRRDLSLPTGATASVAVVVGTAKDALTVPTSAVDEGTVLVVKDGTATPTPVTTGVVGATRVEIVEGLEAGDRVVLADLSAAVPTGDEPDFPGGGDLGSGFSNGTGGGPVRFQVGGPNQ